MITFIISCTIMVCTVSLSVIENSNLDGTSVVSQNTFYPEEDQPSFIGKKRKKIKINKM